MQVQAFVEIIVSQFPVPTQPVVGLCVCARACVGFAVRMNRGAGGATFTNPLKSSNNLSKLLETCTCAHADLHEALGELKRVEGIGKLP